MPDTDKPRNLSRHQYGTLKFIKQHHVTLDHLRIAHANTLGSIAYWGWIARHGTGDNSVIILTKAGEDALSLYERATMNERSHEGDLTERCLKLLAHVRTGNKLVKFAKTA